MVFSRPAEGRARFFLRKQGTFPPFLIFWKKVCKIFGAQNVFPRKSKKNCGPKKISKKKCEKSGVFSSFCRKSSEKVGIFARKVPKLGIFSRGQARFINSKTPKICHFREGPSPREGRSPPLTRIFGPVRKKWYPSINSRVNGGEGGFTVNRFVPASPQPFIPAACGGVV